MELNAKRSTKEKTSYQLIIAMGEEKRQATCSAPIHMYMYIYVEIKNAYE